MRLPVPPPQGQLCEIPPHPSGDDAVVRVGGVTWPISGLSKFNLAIGARRQPAMRLNSLPSTSAGCPAGVARLDIAQLARPPRRRRPPHPNRVAPARDPRPASPADSSQKTPFHGGLGPGVGHRKPLPTRLHGPTCDGNWSPTLPAGSPAHQAWVGIPVRAMRRRGRGLTPPTARMPATVTQPWPRSQPTCGPMWGRNGTRRAG